MNDRQRTGSKGRLLALLLGVVTALVLGQAVLPQKAYASATSLMVQVDDNGDFFESAPTYTQSKFTLHFKFLSFYDTNRYQVQVRRTDTDELMGTCSSYVYMNDEYIKYFSITVDASDWETGHYTVYAKTYAYTDSGWEGYSRNSSDIYGYSSGLFYYRKPAPKPVVKKSNKLTVRAKSPSIKAGTSIAAKKAFTVKKATGKLTFRKASGNKKITVASNGAIRVKKGLKKGTYTIKVKVRAAGNATTKAKTVQVKMRVKVK